MANLGKSPTSNHQFGHLIGQSAAMQSVYHLIEKVAPTKATVLIAGESGTGKELVAKTIHDMSHRATGPFIAINCGAISNELISSALFGHEKGSFTGAFSSHQGYFEQASGGTLFLDELSETSADLQVKLLRVLETGKLIPVGGKRQVNIDVRVVVAMNRNPFVAVKEGILRKDLYYRISTFPITLPLLSARGKDIEILASYFLKQFNQIGQRQVKFTPEALQLLYTLPWEGNVRELRNIVQRAFILADTSIYPKHINNQPLAAIETMPSEMLVLPIGATSLREAGNSLIHATLLQMGNDLNKTADTLGITIDKLTEHLHSHHNYQPNLDKVSGF
jgi:two-component system, NtrC family, response regulator AtoC